MKDKLCVGSESYEEIIHQNGYFVDKTELMYELAAKTSNINIITFRFIITLFIFSLIYIL